MMETLIRECAGCPEKVECVPTVGSGPEMRRVEPHELTPWNRESRYWWHVGGDMRGADGHFADPRPQCPKCDSPRYDADTRRDQWAIWFTCQDCGYADRLPMGD